MKKLVSLTVLFTILMTFSLVVQARTMEADGSAFYGFGEQGTAKTESWGFAVHALVEAMPDVFVDASFLHTSVLKAGGEKLQDGTSMGQQLISLGALYKTVSDSDLQVLVGGGFLMRTAKETDQEDHKGSGIYGKIGIKLLPSPKITIVADLSYSPKYKTKAEKGSLISSRAMVSYQVMPNLTIQASLKHYKERATTTASNTLIGGGVAFSF